MHVSLYTYITRALFTSTNYFKNHDFEIWSAHGAGGTMYLNAKTVPFWVIASSHEYNRRTPERAESL